METNVENPVPPADQVVGLAANLVANLDHIATHVAASVKAAQFVQRLCTPNEAEAQAYAAQAEDAAGRALTLLRSLGASLPNVPDMALTKSADDADNALDLSDDERATLLSALLYARDGKRKERETTAPEPEVRMLYDGDALPPVGTLDGDILRLGALALKMQGILAGPP